MLIIARIVSADFSIKQTQQCCENESYHNQSDDLDGLEANLPQCLITMAMMRLQKNVTHRNLPCRVQREDEHASALHDYRTA